MYVQLGLMFRYHLNISAQETAMYKEHLQKLERQNKEMVERVTEVEQILATNFTPHDTSLLYKKKQIEYVTQQLRSEQQQLYQRINILEVNSIK